MMHSWFALVLFGAVLIPTAALAAPSGETGTGVELAPAVATYVPLRLPSGERLMTLTANSDDGEGSTIERFIPRRDPRRAVLSSLDLATGIVQGFDGFLTLRVLKAGGVETNPLVKSVASNQGALMAIKVSAAVSTVIGAELLWRHDHRVGAIVASLVANSAMVMVARHNAKVLAMLEGR